uniref:ABC-type amino acid transport substrate-binding protein n=1 Tax=Candidatus Kentrum sp. MB TaxID=2138164 RepID=A0A450X238_9GAMM|nr:MAG: ABC-type amino acid transport substrate-binding protein [Candidatus Kentron sp. MB]VFK28412.1 MAG: ABC-type amino acid transport substrate-binding protein [Candidatus Kentron sp. MB]VFK74244.1 MAG: ABC-type amino acid transport substrate-binding protein [Candidatus Kentron sp. MB]
MKTRLALILAIIALGVALFSVVRDRNIPNNTTASDNKVWLQNNVSSLGQARKTRVLKVGYSGFRPYTIINLNETDPSARVEGFCVDLVNEIVDRQVPSWRAEWHKVNFETLRADMESGRFDVFADAVYQTVPRASQFGFTEPYSYFGVGAGIVRKGDSRFVDFGDLDVEGVTVSLAEGWTATEYARRILSKPNFHVVAVGDDPFVQFQEVISGRADIALQDVPTVLQYVNANADKVDALWINNPPTRVAAGFMTRSGDWEMLHFLNVALRALKADGTIARLDRKWKGLGEYPSWEFTLGTGLK